MTPRKTKSDQSNRTREDDSYRGRNNCSGVRQKSSDVSGGACNTVHIPLMFLLNEMSGGHLKCILVVSDRYNCISFFSPLG